MKKLLANCAGGLIGLLLTVPALAGVTAQADYKSTQKDRDPVALHGTYAASGNWTAVTLAFEKASKDGFPNEDYIMDQDQDKATILLHVQKKFMEVDFKMGRMWERTQWLRLFRSGGIRINAREFAKVGYTAGIAREEKLGNIPCTVWVVENVKNNPARFKALVWEAKAPEWNKAPLKIKAEDQRLTSVFTLKNMKQQEIDIAKFSPPKGYVEHHMQIIVGGETPPGMKKNKPGVNTAPKKQ